MKKKITDLEQFASEQIVRPYQTMIPGFGKEKRLKNSPYSLGELKDYLNQYDLVTPYSEWAKLVLDRIYRVGFYFPNYIQHPLVDVIKRYSTLASQKPI